MITTEIGGRFGKRVTEYREGCEAQGWSPERQEKDYLRFMESVELGILRLIDGQTVLAEIREGAILIGEQKVDIPDRSIFESTATLIAHINKTTALIVTELEVEE